MSHIVCTKNGHCTIVNCNGSQFVLNYKLGTPDIRDYVYTPTTKKLSNSQVLSYRNKMPPIWDQGAIGSCVAQSLASTLMFCMKRPFTPSRLFIYYCARSVSDINTNEDTGVEMRMGCKAIAKYGFCKEETYPYKDDDSFAVMPPRIAFDEAQKFKNYVYESVPINVDTMTKCLDEGYPFVIGIIVHGSMFEPKVIKSGDIPTPSPDEDVLGGHAITIVGYNKNDKKFIVRNSWGEKWGDKGYGTIPFDYLGNPNIALDCWVLKCKPHH